MRRKKRLGQNFLTDAITVEKIVSLIPLKGEHVLEIGAGTGFLTKALAEKAKKVTALELDEELFPILHHNLRGKKNVDLLHSDALEHDFSKFKIVFGNIPYSIASPLLFKIIESKAQTAVLMVQKEYADRLTARPGSPHYSRLSVMSQNALHIEQAIFVPRYAFSPVPKVDSAVVVLKRKEKTLPFDEEIVSLLFQHKNQTVRNALGHSAHAFEKEKSELREIAGGSELADKRVKDLSLQELSVLGAFIRSRVRKS